MLEVLGKNYYVDVDTIIEKCRPTYPSKEVKKIKKKLITEEKTSEDPEGGLELNVFKFEVFKACLERALNEYEEADEKLGVFAENSTSISFKIAFNTLVKYDILKEENEQ
jgi:hypothetical protein